MRSFALGLLLLTNIELSIAHPFLPLQRLIEICRRTVKPTPQLKAIPTPQITDAMIFDIYRALYLSPETRPSFDSIVDKLTLAEQKTLSHLHQKVLDLDFKIKKLSHSEEEVLAKLNQIAAAKNMSEFDERHLYPLQDKLSDTQIKRAESLGLPLFRGGQIRLFGSRQKAPQGYHLFIAEDGRKYYSLLPYHSPYTHIIGKSGFSEEAPYTPRVTVEDILKMHEFIKMNAVIPDAVAQPMGLHYVGTQLCVLYEILSSDDEGMGLYYNPTAAIIEQAHQVYGHGHPIRIDKFNPKDDLQGDYIYISGGKIRVGVPVRVVTFLPEVYSGAAFKLKK